MQVHTMTSWNLKHKTFPLLKRRAKNIKKWNILGKKWATGIKLKAFSSFLRIFFRENTNFLLIISLNSKVVKHFWLVPNIYTPKIGLLLSGDQDFPDSQHCKSIDFSVVFEKLYRAEFFCFTKTYQFYQC